MGDLLKIWPPIWNVVGVDIDRGIIAVQHGYLSVCDVGLAAARMNCATFTTRAS